MSRVYFHTRERTVGIGGSERSWFSGLCTRMMRGILDISSGGFFVGDRLARLRRMLDPGHYAAKETDDARFAHLLDTALSGFGECLRWNGQTVRVFSLQLNTALALGSDPMKLAARIHGQCEIHGWVDGPNRAWLAGIIERGLADGVFRGSIRQPPHEWPDAMALLRETAQGEVVMSYSVTEQFPNAGIAGAEDHEGFYEHDKDEQWALAMGGLRARASDELEMKPEGWAAFRFTHELSALDLTAPDWDERLDAKFQRTSPT